MADVKPVDEPISVPDDAKRVDAPPAWLTADESKPAPPPETEESNATGDILVDLVSGIHDKIAEVTFYDGWKLTENDVKLWRKVLRFLLRSLPSKDWPLAIAVVSLMISEAMKFVGYMRFKRENAPAAQMTPTKVVPLTRVPTSHGEPTPDSTAIDPKHMPLVVPKRVQGPPQFLPRPEANN